MAIQSRSRPPTSLSAGNLEHVLQTDREDDAQGDGGGGAEDDAPNPLPARQRATGQRDDDGVVAGEQDIDPDDLEDLDPHRAVVAEMRVEEVDQLGPSHQH